MGGGGGGGGAFATPMPCHLGSQRTTLSLRFSEDNLVT